MRLLPFLVVLAGCARAPLNPNAPEPVRIPEGCEANLGGVYLDSEQAAFRYEGTDDGGTLQLIVERAPPDAGVQRPRSWDPVIRVQRTSRGFVGETRAYAFDPLRCPIHFPTEVTGCRGGGLTIRSAESLQVDPETCAVDPAPPAMRTFQLIRAPATPDAGTPDAGAAPPQDARTAR